MFSVKKETYDNKLIEDYGLLKLENIREIAYEYIGDVFKDEKDIDSDIEYITKNGEEMWLCNDEVKIAIKRVD